MQSTFEYMISHAKFLSKHLNPRHIDHCITAVLLELGIATSRAGFQQLKQGILIHYKNPRRQATKDLYPAIGAMCRPAASGTQVEQTIRTAIQEAWIQRDEGVWMRFFPLNDDGLIEKPTSLDFISRVSRFLEVWQGCYKEGGYETME